MSIISTVECLSMSKFKPNDFIKVCFKKCRLICNQLEVFDCYRSALFVGEYYDLYIVQYADGTKEAIRKDAKRIESV